MNPSTFKRFWKWLIPACILFAVVISAIGFFVDATGFAENLLAEVVGVSVGIVVTVKIVDIYVANQREQQWAQVQNFTLNDLATHLCEITGSIYVHYPGLDIYVMDTIFGGHAQQPNSKVLACFDDLLTQLREIPINEVNRDKKSTAEIAIEYYEAVKWHLDQIRDVLTPRVIQSSAKQKLADALIQFDNVRREFHHSIIIRQQVTKQEIFPHVIALIEASRQLYRVICEY